jgi:hypothetical protein
MIRLQRWESGPYFAASSLRIPDMRSFIHMHEIVKICPHSPTVLIEPVFRYRTPKSDRRLEAHISKIYSRELVPTRNIDLE